MHIFTNPNFNFLRWRWHAVALSWVVILAGLFVIYTRGLPKGIEFAGGTSVIMQFDQTPSVEAVRDALNKNYPGGGQDAIVQSYGDPTLRQVMVRVPQVGAEQGASLNASAQNVENAFQNMVAAYKSYKGYIDAAKAYEESFRITNIRFTEGVIASDVYIQAKTRSELAEVNLSAAKYIYIFRTKVLDYYQGKLDLTR